MAQVRYSAGRSEYVIFRVSKEEEGSRKESVSRSYLKNRRICHSFSVSICKKILNLLKPTGHVMHQQV